MMQHCWQIASSMHGCQGLAEGCRAPHLGTLCAPPACASGAHLVHMPEELQISKRCCYGALPSSRRSWRPRPAPPTTVQCSGLPRACMPRSAEGLARSAVGTRASAPSVRSRKERQPQQALATGAVCSRQRVHAPNVRRDMRPWACSSLHQAVTARVGAQRMIPG
jgi:hypothetical protein